MAVAELRVKLPEVVISVEGVSGVEREDHQTIEAVYVTHATNLTRFATGLVGPSDAADLVGTAMAKCLTAKNWDSLGNPAAYLYRAVYNESQTLYRRASLRSRAYRPIDDSARSAADHATAAINEITVGNALRSLPPRQKAVIILTYWQDRSVRDVADVLGISEGSVKKHLARARAKLREELT